MTATVLTCVTDVYVAHVSDAGIVVNTSSVANAVCKTLVCFLTVQLLVVVRNFQFFFPVDESRRALEKAGTDWHTE